MATRAQLYTDSEGQGLMRVRGPRYDLMEGVTVEDQRVWGM